MAGFSFKASGQASTSGGASGSSSGSSTQQQPSAANDIYNPIADRKVATLVLFKQGKKADEAAVHKLGESGIRSLMKTKDWFDISAEWARLANEWNRTHTRRGRGAVTWWYEGPSPQAGRIRGDSLPEYGNGPDDRADILESMNSAFSEMFKIISDRKKSPPRRPPHLQDAPKRKPPHLQEAPKRKPPHLQDAPKKIFMVNVPEEGPKTLGPAAMPVEIKMVDHSPLIGTVLGGVSGLVAGGPIGAAVGAVVGAGGGLAWRKHREKTGGTAG